MVDETLSQSLELVVTVVLFLVGVLVVRGFTFVAADTSVSAVFAELRL